MSQPLLSLEGLSVTYRTKGGDVPAVRGVDLELARGEKLGVAGESGSGKTTLSRCVAGLTDHYEGTVQLAGRELPRSARDRTAEQLRALQYVFQSPFSSLNPRRTVGDSVAEPLEVHGLHRSDRRGRVR